MTADELTAGALSVCEKLESVDIRDTRPEALAAALSRAGIQQQAESLFGKDVKLFIRSFGELSVENADRSVFEGLSIEELQNDNNRVYLEPYGDVWDIRVIPSNRMYLVEDALLTAQGEQDFDEKYTHEGLYYGRSNFIKSVETCEIHDHAGNFPDETLCVFHCDNDINVLFDDRDGSVDVTMYHDIYDFTHLTGNRQTVEIPLGDLDPDTYKYVIEDYENEADDSRIKNHTVDIVQCPVAGHSVAVLDGTVFFADMNDGLLLDRTVGTMMLNDTLSEKKGPAMKIVEHDGGHFAEYQRKIPEGWKEMAANGAVQNADDKDYGD